jgi:hypothetical protein
MNRDEPAFAGNEDWMHCGLTKREYAAVQIMVGILAHSSLTGNGNWMVNSTNEYRAAFAVEQANALFDELDKEGE